MRDPDERLLLEGEGERQGDYIFTANKVSPVRLLLKYFVNGGIRIQSSVGKGYCVIDAAELV